MYAAPNGLHRLRFLAEHLIRHPGIKNTLSVPARYCKQYQKMINTEEACPDC
jgi:hypothetical protein